MLLNKNKLNGCDKSLLKGFDLFNFALGSKYDFFILVSNTNEDEYECIDMQGGDFNTLNEARKSKGLKPLSPYANFKITRKAWKKNLLSGKAAIIVLQKYGTRYKLNNDIISGIEWFNEQNHSFRIDVIENKEHDVFYLGYKFKETKDDVPKEAHNEEAI